MREVSLAFGIETDARGIWEHSLQPYISLSCAATFPIFPIEELISDQVSSHHLTQCGTLPGPALSSQANPAIPDGVSSGIFPVAHHGLFKLLTLQNRSIEILLSSCQLSIHCNILLWLFSKVTEHLIVYPFSAYFIHPALLLSLAYLPTQCPL